MRKTAEGSKYDMTCDFDMEKHKETYKNYIEVIIDRKGYIQYAVPSHQEMAKRMACEAKGITEEELLDLCPREYYCDFLTWLLMQTGAMAVWTIGYVAPTVTRAQYRALRRLKLGGVYHGALPNISVSKSA